MSEKSSRILKEETIPLEVGKVWCWLKSFDSEWLPNFPAYSAIEILNKSHIKNEQLHSPIGLVRQVVMKRGNVQHTMKERLEFIDERVFTLIYSLQDYYSESSDDESSPNDSDKAAKIQSVCGTIFTICLQPRLSEIDSTPETTILWICQYQESNQFVKSLVNDVIVKGVDSWFDLMEEKYDGAIGKCKVMLMNARNMIKADLMSSDPYCKLRMVDQDMEDAKVSEIKKWTVNPDFNQYFELMVRSKSVELIFHFYDFDQVGGDDDDMGHAKLSFEELQDGVEKQYTVDISTKGQVTFKITMEMFDNKPIPLKPEERKKRAAEAKKKQQQSKNSSSDKPEEANDYCL